MKSLHTNPFNSVRKTTNPYRYRTATCISSRGDASVSVPAFEDENIVCHDWMTQRHPSRTPLYFVTSVIATHCKVYDHVHNILTLVCLHIILHIITLHINIFTEEFVLTRPLDPWGGQTSAFLLENWNRFQISANVKFGFKRSVCRLFEHCKNIFFENYWERVKF